MAGWRTLTEFNLDRDELFRDMTLERATAHWEKAGFPPPHEPNMPLAMAHQARLHSLEATDAMLAESARWLKDNRYGKTIRGPAPLTPATRDGQRMQQGKPPLRLAGRR